MFISRQESGINHAFIRRRGQQQQQQQAEAGPSNASAGGNQDPSNTAEQDGGPSVPMDVCIFATHTSGPPLTLDIEVALDSDHLESEDEVPTGRRRKVSQAALEKQKAAAKKRAKKNKDDDDYEDGEDEYTALSKSFWTSKPGNAKPSVGSLEKCAKCSKQFTVVRSAVIMWRISYLL